MVSGEISEDSREAALKALRDTNFLATVTWAGLWKRIGYVGNTAAIVKLLVFPAIAILLLVSKFAPNDIVYVSAQVDRV